MYNASKQIGMTLVEVLVTVLVVSIGLLGLASLQATSIKEGMDTSKRSQGVWMIDELASRIRVNPAGLEDGYTGAGTAATLCATAVPDCNEGKVCTGNEMARYDLKQTICGPDVADGVIASSNDNINVTDYNIQCAPAPCNSDSDFTITLSWVAKSVADATANNAKYNAQEVQSIQMTVRPFNRVEPL